MKVRFKSEAIQNGQPNNIDFIAELSRSSEEGFDVLSFIEPSRKISNRIEISQRRINIFAGATTLVLKLNEWFRNPFMVATEAGAREVTFFTFLHEVNYDNELETYKIVYDLSTSDNTDELVGKFTITLEIK